MNKIGNHKADIKHGIWPEHYKRFHWKRVHHTWAFWIFLFLMLVAMVFYILSVEFAFAP